MTVSTQVFRNLGTFEDDLRYYLKDRLGPGFYVSRVTDVTEGHLQCKVGTSVPEVIDDAKTSDRVVRFNNYDSVFVMEGRVSAGKVYLKVPDREFVCEGVLNAMREGTQRTEAPLLRSLHDRLVRIPLVWIALTPIRELLKSLYETQTVRVKEVTQRRDVDKTLRYVRFLEGLEIVKEGSPGRYSPGPSYFRHESTFASSATLYNSILAEVLERGYQYLSQYLRLSQIVPFIRVANSYFLPAHDSQGRLFLTKQAFQDKYVRYYGPPKTYKRLFDHVEDVREVRVFDPDEPEYIVGDRDLVSQYKQVQLAVA